MALLLNFSALKNLHDSVNDLLHSPKIQQVLLDQHQEKWIYEVSEASLKMLDVCGISKDVLLFVKIQLHDLQFTLRRMSNIGEFDIETKIEAYNRFRRKLKKETFKYLNSLKAMKNKPMISQPIDHDIVVVVDVLREVRVTTISIVESLLSLISIPWLDKKCAKGSFKLKFLGFRGQEVYGICDELALQSANKRLEAVEIAIEDLEVELDCIFRRLIQTRVSLLNILTN